MAQERQKKARKRSWGWVNFVLGLFLGWLVIGWWLWPVEWSEADPWQLSAEGQRAYVAAVAEGYLLTGDMVVMQERLAGWDEAELTQLLAFMIQENPDAAAQQALNNLREALALPQVNVSFLDLLLSQKAVVVTLIAAAFLLIGAIGLAVYPSLQQAQLARREAQRLAEEAAIAEAEADALSADNPNARSGNSTEMTEDAAANPDNASTNQATPAEVQGGGSGGAAAGGAISAPTEQNKAQPTPAEQATTQVAVQPVAVVRPNGAATPEEQTTVERLLEDTSTSIQELLTSVFDDDEKSAHYDILLKGASDVDITELMMFSEHIRNQLHRENRIRA